MTMQLAIPLMVSAAALAGCAPQQNGLSAAASAPAPVAQRADRPVIVTDDMRNFSEAMARIRRGGDPTSALQSLYLDRASAGLGAFIRRRGMTVKQLAEAVAARPKYYAGLAELWARPERPVRAINSAIAGLQRLYPETRLVPIYAFVGNFTAGGLADPAGVLLSVEIYGDAGGVDLSELGGRRTSIRRLDDIGHLAAHEMIHIQQALAQGVETYMRLFNGGTLLQLAIREGSADYLAHLASGAHTNPAAHAFGSAHEAQVWQAFRQEMGGTNVEGWLSARARGDWPPSLGYFVGYKITEAYFRRSRSREQAVRDTLSVTDYEAFLKASGYGEELSQ